MTEVGASPRPFEPPRPDLRLRVLAVDGGGIRGVIPARLLAHLEALLRERGGPTSIAERFQLVAGTSTGGLIALGLTTPGESGSPRMAAADLVELYEGEDGRAIFRRPLLRRLPVLGRLLDLFRPRYSLGPLTEVLESRLGEATLAEALTGVMVTSYDMTAREPRFLKPWQAQAPRLSVVDAGLATAAAPTFFPSHAVGSGALVDGGVFASNPTVAAIAEALKRTEDPAELAPGDLLVVSLGTGHHEVSHEHAAVRGWGALEWILPRRGGDPPLIGAMLDGQSDAADHWAHMLLNHRPGDPPAGGDRLGAGPRYYRYQVDLPRSLPLDDASPDNIGRLREAAEVLIEARADELAALADALAESS